MDDISILYEVISHGRAAESWFHDENDPEVDRLFNSSPPLIEQVATYELDSVFGFDGFQHSVEGSGREDHLNEDNEKERSKDKNDDDESSHGVSGDSNDVQGKDQSIEVLPAGMRSDEDNDQSLQGSDVQGGTASKKFEHDDSNPIPNKNGTGDTLASGSGAKVAKKSALTFLLETSASAKPEDNVNALRLTIYLPDYSALKVNVSDASTIEETIKKVLTIHEERNLLPPLEYGKASVYELCMHEGDGEPDRDFTLQKSHKIKNYYNPSKPDVNEFCLCETEDSMRDSMRTSSMSRGRSGTLDSLANQPPNTILVTIPSSQRVGNIFLPFTESTTMHDVLFVISEKHRINLCTDHFCFRISTEDQQKFKLMSPMITLDTRIHAIGVRKFELEKRVYEDASRVFLGERTTEARSTNPNLATNRNSDNSARKNSISSFSDHINKRRSVGGTQMNQASLREGDDKFSTLAEKDVAISGRKHVEPEMVEFTNAQTAAGYQEWTIKKKNNYGIKHPRMLGIDGQYIYNYKQNERRGNSGVTTAKRDIKRIVRVTPHEYKKKEFSVTFHGGGPEIYDIEYTCDRAEDRTEILGKLKVLIKAPLQLPG